MTKELNLKRDFNSTVTGSCGDSNATDTQFMVIDFYSDWALTLDFAKKKDDANSWLMDAIHLQFNISSSRPPFNDSKEDMEDTGAYCDISCFTAS